MKSSLRSFAEAVAQGHSSVSGHPLRAALGALAIAVAVAAIVVVVTALDGLTRYARATGARAFGSDTFLLARIATAGQSSRRELAEKQRRNPAIGRPELRFLERQAGTDVIYASTVQLIGDVTAGGRTYENAAISGATPTLVDLRDLGIVRGRFLQSHEADRGAQVAVIGADVADALFPETDAVGQAVRIAGRRFEVVGVQQRLGSSGGTSLDRFVWMPLVTFERIYGQAPTLSIFVRPKDGIEIDTAESVARTALRAKRQLQPGVPDNFDVLTPEAARSFVLRISERVGAASIPISAMALLAAIVVITNTTLVSVTQKTREIGVRRAVGASRGQIMREVVAESVIVSLAGGLAGSILTAGAVSLLAGVLKFDVVVRLTTVAWAVGAAALSGLVAGYYPARRATRIDVISAVRAE
jgi:putative ABC transport system permease protein